MTEEQRMEEGRRMFQIFAARMFEQRVLTAYREKVAAERQRKLLEELDEESRLDTQREAKKAREAAKKKEKKKLQKQVKDEEKAKKDSEKAAQEATIREAEDKKLEEQRQRREDQRKKREAEKKATEEERLRKEADKHRKQQEVRDRQAEQERRAREAKDRERQKREDAKRKEREEREAREKESNEQKAKEEHERRAQEEHARKQKEVASRTDKVQHQPPRNQPVALPPGLQPPSRGPSIHSPHVAVATPVVPPKIPTPVRNRQPSQPGPVSHGSSPRSQKASTDISRSSASPAMVAVPHTPAPGQPAKMQGQPPPLHHPQPSAPRSPLNNNHHGRGQYPFHMNGLPGLGVSGPPMGPPGMMPMMPPMMYQGPPPMINQQRYAQNGLQFPPGFPRPFQPGQQMPFVPQPPAQAPPTMVSQPPTTQKQQIHSRHPSNEHAPIGRPGGLGPIARPSSTTPDKQKPHLKTPDADVEQLTTQLGSKALLDDSDAPFDNADPRASLAPLGPPGSSRLPFASSYQEHKQEPFGVAGPGWGGFNPGMAPSPNWGPPGVQRPGPGWGQPPFGSIGPGPQVMSRSHLPRPIAVRLMLVQACRQLSQIPGASTDGYHPVPAVLRHLDALKVPGDANVSMDEMLGICDTEGNSQNGGGSFEVIIDKARGQVVKFVEDAPSQPPRGSVGEIGSPILGHSQHIHHNNPLGGIVGQPLSQSVGQTSNFGPPGRSF